VSVSQGFLAVSLPIILPPTIDTPDWLGDYTSLILTSAATVISGLVASASPISQLLKYLFMLLNIIGTASPFKCVFLKNTGTIAGDAANIVAENVQEEAQGHIEDHYEDEQNEEDESEGAKDGEDNYEGTGASDPRAFSELIEPADSSYLATTPRSVKMLGAAVGGAVAGARLEQVPQHEVNGKDAEHDVKDLFGRERLNGDSPEHYGNDVTAELVVMQDHTISSR